MQGEETRGILDPGGSLTDAWADSRLRKMREDCDLLLQLVSQSPGQTPALLIAFQLLAYGVAPRADHLFRMISPSLSAPLAEAVDQLLLETTEQLFGFELDAS